MPSLLQKFEKLWLIDAADIKEKDMQLKFTRLAVVPAVIALIAFAGAPNAQATGAKHCAKKGHHACAKRKHMCHKTSGVGCTIACNKDLKTFSKEMRAAGMCRTLGGKTHYTVFASTEAAYAKYPKGYVDGEMADKDQLRKVMKYHVVARKLTPEDLSGMRSVTTMEGESLMLNNKDGKIIVDGAMVTGDPIRCCNGTVYMIDDVLSPQRGK